MLIRIILTFMCATSLIWAEDAPKPPTKKEIFPAIPHFWVSEGVVCMQAKENNLSFANQPQDISHLNFTNTSLISPQFKWAIGMQIDLGYQPKKQLYFASWSYVQNRASGSKSTNGVTGFFPVLSMNPALSVSSYVTSANFNWWLNTQLGDIGTIFPWHPSRFFLLKTQIGLRLAFLYQKVKTYYGGGIFSQGTDALKMKNNFFGVGPRVALIPNVFLPAGFSLSGEIAAYELLGRFYIKQEESYLGLTQFYQTRVMTRWRFGLDAKAYLAWQKELLYKAILFSMQIGWKWRVFFDQNKLNQNAFHLSNSNDNLYLQGGFLSLSIAF